MYNTHLCHRISGPDEYLNRWSLFLRLEDINDGVAAHPVQKGG